MIGAQSKKDSGGLNKNRGGRLASPGGLQSVPGKAHWMGKKYYIGYQKEITWNSLKGCALVKKIAQRPPTVVLGNSIVFPTVRKFGQTFNMYLMWSEVLSNSNIRLSWLMVPLTSGNWTKQSKYTQRLSPQYDHQKWSAVSNLSTVLFTKILSCLELLSGKYAKLYWTGAAIHYQQQL